MLLLGDVVSDFRACLNYLAWDVVRVGTEPKPRDRGRVKFPIVTTNRDRFDAAANICLPGVRAEHVAIIERHQPYHVAREVVMVLGPASRQLQAPSAIRLPFCKRCRMMTSTTIPSAPSLNASENCLSISTASTLFQSVLSLRIPFPQCFVLAQRSPPPMAASLARILRRRWLSRAPLR